MIDTDAPLQRAVLDRLFELGPMSVEELTRDLTVAAHRFDERDPVERAIRDLIRAGLAHRHGGLVMPSRAATRFHELAGC